MFQERGVFCQFSLPGRPGIDTVLCPKATAELSHTSSPDPIYLTTRDFMFFSSRR